MTAQFLSLPRKVRERIYGYVWCSSPYVRFGESMIEEEWKMADGPRFPEKQVSRYPPNAGKSPTADLGRVPTSRPPCKQGSSEKSPWKDIEFDVDDWFAENPAYDDDEEDEENDDGFEDSDGEDGYSDEDDFLPRKSKRNGRHELDCFTKVDLALFYTSRQIYEESLPVFFSQTTLVFDTTARATMQFLNSLPTATLINLASIALTSAALMMDDADTRVAWSGSAAKAILSKNGLSLVTPFAAFLSQELPNLKSVYFYVPKDGHEDWYADMAVIDLSVMLKHGRIKRLYHVFMGEDAAKVFKKKSNGKNPGSIACYERLMGSLADGQKLAEHEYAMKHPPLPRGKNEMSKYTNGEEQYAKENARPFVWRWADRDVDMGSDGTVQAVIACSM